VHIGWWWRNLNEGNNLENIAVYGRIILKGVSNKLRRWDKPDLSGSVGRIV
jgi:hypothetical protein